MLNQKLTGAAAGAAPEDTNFKNVSLLLQGDGTNGAQNNTFVDSSSNNFTITRNGNTTQGTFSPYGNLWSNYFDGSGDYLTTASSTSSSFEMDSGDYTVEFWMYPMSNSDGGMVFKGLYQQGGTWQAGFGVRRLSDTLIRYYFNTTNSNSTEQIYDYTGTTTVNTWYHVAMVVRSGVGYAYLNGQQVGTKTGLTAIPTSSTGITIGAFPYSAGNFYFNGYLSNLRLVKGTAVYTSNFTPPSLANLATSGSASAACYSSTTNVNTSFASSATSLLTCQSNRFKDNSANNFTLTVNGNTSVQRFSPFNPTAAYSAATIGGSGYFDGSGDYLTLPTGQTPLLLGNSDFTFEAWVYRTSGTGTANIFIGQADLATTSGSSYVFYISSTANSDLYVSSSTYGIPSPNVPLNTWSHVAWVRTGGTYSSYLNGVRVGTRSDLGTLSVNVGSTSYPAAIGAFSNAISNPLNGYISNARLIKGSGGYNATQSTITVPTAPLTPITNTSLLLNFTNAGIPDAAMMNDLETVGNAQVSTTVKKYGTGSMYFDGSGDWLTIPATPNLYLGSGDFTVEFWIYPTSSTGVQYLISQATGTFSTSQFDININAGNIAGVVYYGSSYVATSTTAVTSNTWTHIAFVRSGSNLVIYKNGVSSGTGTIGTNTLNSPTGEIRVGALNNATPYAYIGYIDDLRITKGYARYPTEPFPTAALPTY